jgi:pimeloyl-ACP methyl ester carboxylesterase
MKEVALALLAASFLIHPSAFASDGTGTTSKVAMSGSVSKPFRSGPCQTVVYRIANAPFVALTLGENGFDYTFSDGRAGNTSDAGSLLHCGDHAVMVGSKVWPRVPIVETISQFVADGVMLAGRLMEAPGASKKTPLVVYAHGSEEGGWIDRARDPYQMVGRGVSVFVYDKRGTGGSQGKYTQNFPRLADDLVIAAREAKRLAEGRHGRFGLVGLSQGGWIVPLAAGRAQAEFIGIGYGLAVDIAEEDAAQVTMELQERGYSDDIVAKGRTITAVTARVVKSGYRDGLEELESMQQQFGKAPWFAAIKGAYTGVFLNMSVDIIRKNGMPRFDSWHVDWSQDPMQVLQTVTVPQLWVFAKEDRQAPIGQSLERLAMLRKQGKPITMVVFPEAEHGMWNYEQAPDFSRKHTRVAAGFYDLMADWAKGSINGKYGNSRSLRDR